MPITHLFASTKDFLELNLHLSRDALHVHVGIVLFFALVFVLQRHPRRFLLALAGLFAVCLVNEAMDYLNAMRLGHVHRWLGSLKDIINTMLWPAVIVYAGPAVARLYGFAIARAGSDGAVERLTALPGGSEPMPERPTVS